MGYFNRVALWKRGDAVKHSSLDRYSDCFSRDRRPRRANACSRRAASLVELVVVLLFVPLTLGTVVFSLATVHRADRGLLERIETQRTAQRLALTLREDCRVSTIVTSPSPEADSPAIPRLLVFQQPDGSRVEYSLGDGQVERRVLRGEALVHRDSHHFSEHWSFRVSVLPGAPRVLQLKILPLGAPRAGRIERTFEFAVLTDGATPRPRRRGGRLGAGVARRRMRRLRRGVLLVVALVGLLVVGLFTSAAFQRAIAGRREARVRARQWQSAWLADSAVRRASAQLAKAPTYRGETWRVTLDGTAAAAADSPSPANSLTPGTDAGVAVILVEPQTNDARRLRVSISARYPADDVFGVQSVREFTLPLPSPGDSP